MRGSASATTALSFPAPASLYRSRELGTGGIPGTVTTASVAGDGGASPVTANDAAAAATQSIATTVRRGNRCCIEHPVIGEGRIIAQIACRADHWRLVALRIASIVCAMMISTPNWP